MRENMIEKTNWKQKLNEYEKALAAIKTTDSNVTKKKVKMRI